MLLSSMINIWIYMYLCSSHKSFISFYQFLCLWRKPFKQQRKLSLAVLNKSKMVLEFRYQNKFFTLHFFNIVIFNQHIFMLTIEHTKTSHFHWWSINNVQDVTGYYGVQDIHLRPSFYRVLLVEKSDIWPMINLYGDNMTLLFNICLIFNYLVT